MTVWVVQVAGRPSIMVKGETVQDALDAYARSRGFRDFATSGMRLDDKTSALGARDGRDSIPRAKPDL
jgi:hypothetical protein